MDLLVPWAISAVFVLIFFFAFLTLGVWSWVISCLAFLFLCAQHGSMRKSAPARHEADQQEPEGEE